MPTFTEENYLKAIFRALEERGEKATTSILAEHLATSAPAVSDMLKKLSDKGLIYYERYQSVTLTETGRKVAIGIIRKHRLWEVFLVEKLGYRWNEVHDIAEQLEHIHANDLIDRLDAFLDYPKTDPHGDPIPDQAGRFSRIPATALSQVDERTTGQVSGIADDSTAFMHYLERIGLTIGAEVTVTEKIEYDQSIRIRINGRIDAFISHEAARNINIRVK